MWRKLLYYAIFAAIFIAVNMAFIFACAFLKIKPGSIGYIVFLAIALGVAKALSPYYAKWLKVELNEKSDNQNNEEHKN